MPELERRIGALLRERYLADDLIWWVHNYQLGKNPAFTAALVELLETAPRQKAVFQIHDFPECARFENLAALRSHLRGTVYPIASNIAYATINERDRRLLVEAGLPSESVFALPNPVPPPSGAGSRSGAEPDEPAEAAQPGDARRADILRRLGGASGTRFPGFDPEGLLFLYPVRAIRRKNVLEAGFLTRLFNASSTRRANVVVTLPGVSPMEKPYSDMVHAAFSDGTMPGMAGAGQWLEAAGLTFAELAESADLIVSTSVQEGFGYAFFEAPAWGRPLCARYLDVLDGLDHLFEGTVHLFYRQLQVPFESPSIDSIRTLLRIRYDEQLERAGAHMPPRAREHVEAEIERMLSAESIDFSFLMPQMQYSYTKDLADEGFANEIRALNLELLGSLSRLLDERARATASGSGAEAPGSGSGAAAASVASQITRELGYERYAEHVLGLLEALTERTATAGGGSAGRAESPDPVQERLIEAFAHKDYFRLLYGPVGE
jgi:hypothetical protein